MADKYCCFWHPKKDYSLKELEDTCSECGRNFGFPLDKKPVSIRDLQIDLAAGRGFYGVTYKARTGRFGKVKAVKVIPRALYEYFGKNFTAECESHHRLAANTEHLAQIEDAYDEDVRFGDEYLPCHVAVLTWVDGVTLHDLLVGQQLQESTVIAQIALDLLSLLNELQRGEMRHNDLHKKNIVIEFNPSAPPRIDRIHSDVRAIAVDFGSIDDASLSGDSRLGDLANVGAHIRDLTEQIRTRPASETDLNWRLAFALDQTARTLLRDPTSQRVSFADLRSEIANLAIHRARTPVWRSSFELTSFSEHYNAQTIESAYIPDLLVLPEHSTWSDEVRIPGPQVVSGMRGCGKTMLLKSLDFHARAFRTNAESTDQVVSRLKGDRYVGLFLACAKLLDQSNKSPANLHVRLLVGYTLSALRICQHLRDLKQSCVDSRFAKYLAEALSECITPITGLDSITSEYKLEEFLVRTQLQLGQEDVLTLKDSPINVFPVFAGVFEKLAPEVFGGSHVLFLLDDVSTRFISKETISELISALLFSSEKCSFKFTTEAQTLELVLKSPGRIEQARQGRDYTVFNLGSEVSRLIRGKGKRGKKFIADVLERRRQLYLRHPSASPSQILGDQPLSQIAEAIGKAFEQSEGRKRIYWGLSALTNLCVGDVGEVIRLYEDIIKQAKPGECPVSAELQHKCFQHICTSALHDVNRKKTKFKDHALGFANAAHKLLRKSLSMPGNKRIRQYAQVYVSISTDNPEWIFEEIRELVDAGIYTLDSSTAAPRAKRANADPMQQFILTYRKLYGISTLIGLAYRDRFELSGVDLEAWLREPSKVEEVFLRNEGGSCDGDEDLDPDEEEVANVDGASEERLNPMQASQTQLELWSGKNNEKKPRTGEITFVDDRTYESLNIKIEKVRAPRTLVFDLVVAGLGFEDRCYESLKRLVAAGQVKRALLIQYSMPGRSSDIFDLFEAKKIPYEVVSAQSLDILSHQGSLLIDVSGLDKPTIFHFCRSVMQTSGRVSVCHTLAKHYFPSEEEISPIIQAGAEEDISRLLEGVSGVFKGEEQPYEKIALLVDQQDKSRPRALLACASAKHERLLSLIDERYYDYVGIAYSSADSGRGKISEMAAKFAVRNINRAVCYPVSAADLESNVKWLARLYYKLYHECGYNVEIGLTGSKVCGLAAAIIASQWKIAQAWYVKPAAFNSERFTTGAGTSQIYNIYTE